MTCVYGRVLLQGFGGGGGGGTQDLGAGVMTISPATGSGGAGGSGGSGAVTFTGGSGAVTFTGGHGGSAGTTVSTGQAVCPQMPIRDVYGKIVGWTSPPPKPPVIKADHPSWADTFRVVDDALVAEMKRLREQNTELVQALNRKDEGLYARLVELEDVGRELRQISEDRGAFALMCVERRGEIEQFAEGRAERLPDVARVMWKRLSEETRAAYRLEARSYDDAFTWWGGDMAWACPPAETTVAVTVRKGYAGEFDVPSILETK